MMETTGSLLQFWDGYGYYVTQQKEGPKIPIPFKCEMFTKK